MKTNDINLSSFKIRKELNPKFWPNGKLNSRVRLRLLDIADDFIKELAVDWVKPKDVILTGSIANYNWSRYSDVDIHIQIDFKKVYPKNTEFVDDYFKSKKENWLSNHEDLKIFGFPIEISVEDSNENNPSSGRYSLYKNKWIVEPNDFQDAVINQDYVKRQAAKYMSQIDDIENKLNNENDLHKCENYGEKIYKIFDKLKNLRSDGLASDKKEMSSGNIIYKIIRRAGYIDKIWDIYNSSYDKVNSISERKEINEAQKRGEKFSAGIIPFRFNEKGNTEVFLGLPGKPKKKNINAPYWMNHWQIMKGHVENGENPLDCAVREFQEESGVASKYLNKKRLINLGKVKMNDKRTLICYGIDLTDNDSFDSTRFHSNMIDSKKYIELNNGKPYPEIERYGWKQINKIEDPTKYEKDFYDRCNKICQERYNAKKTVVISDKQKQNLKESFQNELVAYHGTGRNFNKFDNSFMGSGEGAQAHGWGIYVTVNKDVAKMYSSSYVSKLRNIQNKISFIKSKLPQLNGITKDNAEKELKELQNKIESNGNKIGAFVYEVEIPDNNGSNYIEEDTRVPEALWQTLLRLFKGEKLQTLRNIMKMHYNDSRYLWRDLIKSLEYILGSPKDTSLFLHKIGYIGIHYNGRLDGECYVIFNEKDIKIINKGNI